MVAWLPHAGKNTQAILTRLRLRSTRAIAATNTTDCELVLNDRPCEVNEGQGSTYVVHVADMSRNWDPQSNNGMALYDTPD